MVLVVGACQESVALPLVGGGGLGAGGLVLAVVEGPVAVDALVEPWLQPAITHTTSKTPANFVFKSQTPTRSPVQPGHRCHGHCKVCADLINPLCFN